MKIAFSRNALIKFYLAFSILFLLSFLRPVLFILLPCFIAFHFVTFNTKYSKYSIVIVLPILVLLNTMISTFYIGEFYIGNFILSTYILMPMLLLFFSKSKIKDSIQNDSYFTYFMKTATWFLVVSNCIGFIQIAVSAETDDTFVGLYGDNGLGVHTLSIINFIVCSYYFFKYSHGKTWNNLLLCLFFLLSGIVCFYGLGLIVLMVSVIVYNLSLKSALKSAFISFFIVVFLGFGLYFIKPKTFQYNYDNLKIVRTYIQEDIDVKYVYKIPRKLILYKNYFSIYVKDPVLFLLGSGPGTFNSRSSFLLNGDYSKSKFFEKTLGIYHPQYAVIGAHSLWNFKNVNPKYLDGTRNEPFSSIVSILSEYGFIFFILLSVFVYFEYKILYNRFNNYLKNHANIIDKENTLAMYKHLKFTSVFIFLNLFTDNYLEYPEIIMFYLLTYKLIELRLNNLNDFKGN